MNEKDLFSAIGEIADDLIMEERKMKNTKFKKAIKISLIAAAIVVFAGVSTWAGSRIVSSGGSSSSIPDYYSMPSEETLVKDIGMAPVLVEEFSNGYKFKSGHISNNYKADEDGHKVEETTGLSAPYERDGDHIHYSADNTDSMDIESDKFLETYKGADIYYSKWMNKFVPGNYVQTEQDKEDEASGKYVFSYGTDKVEIKECQFIGWVYDGIQYSLSGMNTPLTEDDFIQMAHELIDAASE